MKSNQNYFKKFCFLGNIWQTYKMNIPSLPFLQTPRRNVVIPNVVGSVLPMRPLVAIINRQLKDIISGKNQSHNLFDFLNEKELRSMTLVIMLNYNLRNIALGKFITYLYKNNYLKIIERICTKYDIGCFSETQHILLSNEVDVVFNKINQQHLLLYSLITNSEKKEYLYKKINKITLRDAKGIIGCNDIEFLTTFYDKIENVNNSKLVKTAERYKNNQIIDFVYSKEPNLDTFIDPSYLLLNTINSYDKFYIRNLLLKNDINKIIELYTHCINIKMLNERLCFSLVTAIPLRKYLFSKDVKITNFDLLDAAYNGKIDIFVMYFEKYQMIKWNKIDTIMNYAAYGGQTDIIEFLLIKMNTVSSASASVSNEAYLYAIHNGQTHLVKRLHQIGVDIPMNVVMDSVALNGCYDLINFFVCAGFPITQHTTGNASTGNHIRLIQNILNIKIPIISVRCFDSEKNEYIYRFFNSNYQELSSETVQKGIRYGKLQLVDSNQSILNDSVNKQLLITNIVTNASDIKLYHQLGPIDEGTITTTARHGHLELLNYLITKEAPINQEAFIICTTRGYTEIFKSLYYYKPELVTNEIVILASKWNRCDIIDFLCKKGYKIPKMSKMLKLQQDIDIFQYGDLTQIIALDKNKITRNSLFSTVLNGHFHVVKYLFNVTKHDQNIVKFDAELVSLAARRGRLNILKFLYENGCETNDTTLEYPIIRGRKDIVQYLISVNFKINAPKSVFVKLAKQHNYYEISQILENWKV